MGTKKDYPVLCLTLMMSLWPARAGADEGFRDAMRQGKALEQQGDVGEAVAAYNMAYRQARQSGTADDVVHAGVELSKLYTQQKRPGDSQAIAEATIRDVAAKRGEPGTRAAAEEALLATLLDQLKFEEAIASARRAVDLRTTAHDTSSEEYALDVGTVGLCLAAKGQYKEALPHLEKATAMLEQLHPAGDPGRNRLHLTLGKSLSKCGQWDRAESYLREEYARASANLGSVTGDIRSDRVFPFLNCLDTLAEHYADRGNSTDGLRLYVECAPRFNPDRNVAAWAWFRARFACFEFKVLKDPDAAREVLVRSAQAAEPRYITRHPSAQQLIRDGLAGTLKDAGFNTEAKAVAAGDAASLRVTGPDPLDRATATVRLPQTRESAVAPVAPNSATSSGTPRVIER